MLDAVIREIMMAGLFINVATTKWRSGCHSWHNAPIYKHCKAASRAYSCLVLAGLKYGKTMSRSLNTSVMPCAPPRGRRAQGSSYPQVMEVQVIGKHEVRYTRGGVGGDDVRNGVAKAT